MCVFERDERLFFFSPNKTETYKKESMIVTEAALSLNPGLGVCFIVCYLAVKRDHLKWHREPVNTKRDLREMPSG